MNAIIILFRIKFNKKKDHLFLTYANNDIGFDTTGKSYDTLMYPVMDYFDSNNISYNHYEEKSYLWKNSYRKSNCDVSKIYSLSKFIRPEKLRTPFTITR